MSLKLIDQHDRIFASPPVFDGLEKLGQSGQKIAEIVGVSPPTVSKWRKGHVAVPDDVLALLTLVLASCVEDILDQTTSDGESRIRNFRGKASLLSAREDLAAQEKINHQLLPIAVRAGAIKFRYWWNMHLRNRLPEMALSSAPARQSASVL